MNDCYEVYAVKYAQKLDRFRRDNFIVADAHDTPLPMDYFVWAIVNSERTIVVDTGFGHADAERRGREMLRLPREGLALVGIDAAQVREVVVTHLHYDHAGTLEDFPNARFHLNDREMAHATGRMMGASTFRRPYTVEHVCRMIEAVYEDRVVFHDAGQRIAPGVSVHHIGGHTPGMQSVRVNTARGQVVLASDAAHYYENFLDRRPYPTVCRVDEMVLGWDTLQRLADSPRHVVPGHDPQVLQHYRAGEASLEGIVARLHEPPIANTSAQRYSLNPRDQSLRAVRSGATPQCSGASSFSARR
jgi:glyoxylase-like metal-dependent hydrolase (beta-lactamase superfamily II)